ncbi:Cna B-type domain-containing protein [Lederbergia ruris]|uniref:Cna B-type domain-containing protein n=1 Tax=Lederbergia ruris TaxID=217495 RepID=UPI0039A2D4B7
MQKLVIQQKSNFPPPLEWVTTPKEDIIVEGVEVGTYHVENGVLRFVFNENIENDDVHNGYVNLGLEFNLEKFRENIEQQIPFNDDSESNITVIARPNLEHSGIEKEGHPDTKHDAREITWTIDVINTNDEEISEATLEDNIPDGLGNARDFVIHELSVGYDGDIRKGADVTSTLNPSEFPIELGTIAPFNGYRIQYTTTIENYAAESFTNEATFEYGDTSLPAKATVGGLTRSNPVEKNGWQIGDSDVIQWQVDVNKNGSLISEAIIEDSLPDGLTVDPDSIQVVKITQNGGNWVEGEAHSDSFTGFPINLGALGQDDAYRIKFKTDVDWSKVNNSDYQKENGFQNEATLKDGENELNSDDATVNIVRDPVLRKEGVSNVDYDNKTVSWTIHINEAGHPIGNVVLTDLIPEGLAISESDIKITDEEGNDYTPKEISLDPDAEGGTAVVINLGDVGTHKLKVKYTTKITDFTKNNFNNSVGMTGEGIGEDGENSNAEIKPEGNTYGKSFKGIDYNAKTMSWQLNVNPRREAIDSLVIEDTFPNKGMILLSGSVIVNHAGNELVEGTDYTLAPRTEDGETGYHKGFTITLLDNALPLDGGQLVVDYTTSYDPQYKVDGHTLDPHVRDGEQDKVYRNRAHFEGETVNGNPIDETRNADTRVRDDSWNSGKKEGQFIHVDSEGNQGNGWVSGGERKIAWQLYTNYQEQNLGKGVSITDTLAYAGNIDEDSIKVSVYDVDTNGETTIKDTVLDSDNYTVTGEGNKFTLTFAEGFEVTERYVVEFTTSVPDISAQSYTNNATVTAGGVDYPYNATLNYGQYDNFLEKGAIGLDGDRVFTGDVVKWEATVNESLSIIKNAVITDKISAGHVYLSGSLEVYKAQELDNALVEGTDYTLNVSTTDDGENVLTINMEEDLRDTLVLKYTTVVTAKKGQIGNRISLDGNAIDQQVKESSKLNARQFSDAGGEWAPKRGALSVKKVDSETGETITNETTFTLWYDLNGKRVQYTQEEAFTTVDGVLEIGNLPLRTYYLVEEKAPTGYVLSEEEIEIDVNKAYNNNEENVVTKTFKNTKEKIDVTGTKVWQGGENQRPESIELQLFRNGKALGDPVTLKAGETEYTWSNLDKTDIDGKVYQYTVDEVKVPENYEKSISEDGLTITNKFVSPTTEIPVRKVWQDANNQDGNRPKSIEVALFANGKETEVDNKILDSENEWQDEFTNLPEFDNSGDKITYTVKEVNVPDQYDSNITGDAADGFVITNSYTPSTIDIPVEKVWKDGNNQDGKRSNSITVSLLADGKPTGQSIILNALNNWQATFTNLNEYQAGKKITYKVEEPNVPTGYDRKINGNAEDGYTITNSYTPEVTDITVNKVWDDADNQDGARPDSITINLYDDRSQVMATAEISAADNWSHVFENLPKYRDGNEIKYSVAENTVEDYSTVISNNGDGTFTVANKHTPEQTSVTVNKFWNDGNDQDGKRPDSIRVQLLADGEPLGDEVLVTAADGWSYTWTGLDTNRDGGKVIKYSVEEVKVPAGYKSEINNENHGAITITNSRAPELINIPVKKEWDDANNQDGKRPESITVRLINDSNQVVATAEITADEDGKWSHVFENVPKYRDGNKIEYRVVEDAIEDYSTTTAKQADGFVIANSYTPEQTSMSVHKAWNDGNNQDGVRPDHVTVQLFADGEPVKKPVRLSAENDWAHSWTELNVYQNGGQQIEYTVKEISVPKGYEEPTIQEANGNVLITNNRTPDTVEIPVTKVWDDAEDQDGVRPDSVTVNVLNDLSEIVGTAELNEENDWAHTFKDLPKNRNGEEIRYRVTEDNVPAYSTELETSDKGNVTIINAYTPEQTSVTVSKGWNDNDNQDGIRPEQVKVQLYAGVDKIGDPVTLSAKNDWMHTWSELDAYQNGGEEINYTVKEVSVPKGYEVSINDADHGNIILTNHHTPEQTSINVTKKWADADNQDGIRPDSITVNLLANGEEIDSIELDKSNNWQADFTELDKFKNGELIDYTVEEVAVDGYETETTGNADDGYVITNNHEPELIDLEGTKIWDDADNQDGKRPESITVHLLANDDEVEAVEVSEETDWNYAFTDLPKFENGKEINYTIQEDNVEGYSTKINGLDITNSYTPEQISINVSKTWADANNQDGIRPESITVNLLADGEKIRSEKVTAATDWSYNFTDLPKYSAGEEIVYTISEEAVEGYETTIEGYNITNTHNPEVTEVAGEKTWDDANNQDGVRPEKITVNLLANGEKIHSVEVTEKDDWKYSFTDLPKYNAGEEIVYTVTENTIEDYTTEVKGYDITNHHTPGKTSVTVTKHWDDANNQDGIRPASIEVQLTANGESVGDPVKLSEENNWTYTWDELDAKASGKTIVYSVAEITEVPGYKTTVNDENHGNIMMTNTHTPEVTEVAGEKIWDDADNQDGLRPEKITVNLLANGEKIHSVEVTEKDDWKYSLTDLPKYKAGEEITYTVDEEAVEGYEKNIDGFNITNKLIYGTVELTKYNEKDEVLAGATFELQDQAGEVLQTDLTTDQAGKIIVSDLKPGDYQFVEVKAPVGYELDKTPIVFTIEKGQKESTKVKAINKKSPAPKPGDPEDPERPGKDPVDNKKPEGGQVSTETPKYPTNTANKKDSNYKQGLPNTATNYYNMILLGISLVIIGLVSYLIYRRRTE